MQDTLKATHQAAQQDRKNAAKSIQELQQRVNDFRLQLDAEKQKLREEERKYVRIRMCIEGCVLLTRISVNAFTATCLLRVSREAGGQ